MSENSFTSKLLITLIILIMFIPDRLQHSRFLRYKLRNFFAVPKVCHVCREWLRNRGGYRQRFRRSNFLRNCRSDIRCRVLAVVSTSFLCHHRRTPSWRILQCLFEISTSIWQRDFVAFEDLRRSVETTRGKMIHDVDGSWNNLLLFILIKLFLAEFLFC